MIEYRPLEEVREEIINTLAEETARPLADAQFAEAELQVKRIQQLVRVQGAKIYELDAQSRGFDEDDKPKIRTERNWPTDPAVKKLINELNAKIKVMADKSKIHFGHTGKITQLNVRDWNEKEATKADPPYASLLRARESRIDMTRRTNAEEMTFARLAFQQDMRSFEPFELLSFRMIGSDPRLSAFSPPQSNIFVSWRTADTRSYTPELKAIKADVAKAWKVAQAANKAFEAADTIVKNANKQKTTLAELLPDRDWDIKRPEKFVMSNFPFASLQLSGESIEEIFTLKPGEKKALRSSRYLPTTGEFKTGNSTYLIRIISITPDEMQLRNDFLASLLQHRINAPVDPNQRMQIGRGWLQDLETEFELDWIRTAQEMER